MDEVEVRAAAEGVAVAVGDVVLHTAENTQQAEQLAAWVRYQIGQGYEVDAIARLLRGETVGSAEPDLALLEGSIGDLKRALASGEHDEHLDALLEAEQSGKDRRGAVAALEARRTESG